MRNRIIALFSAFIISINCLGSMTLNVYASNSDEPMTTIQRDILSNANTFFYLCRQVGVVFNPSLWGSGALYDNFVDWLMEGDLISDSYSVDDFYDAHIIPTEKEDGEYEFYFDTEIMNSVYNFATDYIENNTPYCNFVLNDTSLALGSECNTHQQYEFIANWDDDKHFLYQCGYVYTTLGGALETSEQYLCYIPIPYTVDFVFDSAGIYYAGGYYKCAIDMYNDWEVYYPERIFLDEDGNEVYRETLTSNVVDYCSLYSDGQPMPYSSMSGGKYYYSYFVTGQWNGKSGSVRAFFSVADMKNYSANTRPYYLASQYFDYSTENDNSTTISENDLQNSSIYGDVYNIIIEYDDPDGLTEEELRRILDEYLKRIQDAVDDDDGNDNDDDSGGSSSDDDDDDDSGGGLLDLLEGIGKFFDGILSVLGKLLEYVGKAVTLVTDTLSSIVDKIPASVTGMLAAAFPMLPEEWFSVIELALVLGVLGIVIKLLKG